MMESQIAFVDRLGAVFGPPKTEDLTQFAREYAKALSDFSADELGAAADGILLSRKYSAWPTIAECIDACTASRRVLALAKDGSDASQKGTGWRVSDSGKRWFRIERGTKEFDAWMKFYRDCGRGRFAAVAKATGCTFVPGPSPIEHGPAMLAYLDANKPKSMGEAA